MRKLITAAAFLAATAANAGYLYEPPQISPYERNQRQMQQQLDDIQRMQQLQIMRQQEQLEQQRRDMMLFGR
jgi:hypothetical protein